MALQTKTFSQSNNSYTLDLIITEESTSVIENTSALSFRLQLRSGSTRRFSNYRVAAHITLDGTVVASRQQDWSNQISLGANSSIEILSGTTTIVHNQDGAKSIPVAFGIEMAVDSASPGIISVTDKTMELTTIPRASTITATAANVSDASVIVVNRKASTYTHSVALAFGGISGYLNADGEIVDAEVKLSQTTLSFVVPESFYKQIPEAPSGTCTLTCKTYSGNTQIGSAQTGKFTITADKSLCAPSVAGSVIDVNEITLALTGDPGKLVKYCSTAQCTILATPKNEAYIKEKKIAGTVIEGDLLNILNVELSNISFSAKDSRGYSGDFSVSVEMIPYIKLSSNPSIKRTDPTSGNAQLLVTGNYFQGSFGAVSNALTVRYRVGSGEYVEVQPTIGDCSDYTVDVIIPNLDYTKAYSIEVVVADAISTVTKTVTVGKGIPVFDWGQDSFRFNVPVYLGESALDYIEEQGESNGWYYRKWNSGIAECWMRKSGTVSCNSPWGSLYYGEISASKFPTSLFTETPVLITAVENQNLFLVKYATTMENTGRSFAVSPSAISDQEYTLQYIAKGKWKQEV